MLQRLTVLILLISGFISCTTFTAKSPPIEFKDRQTLVFTGKGAAAGIMLDSVMGGVGVAIGIAIDEGIAKDIAKSIYEINPDYDFLKVGSDVLQANKGISASQKRLLKKIVINSYGFRTFSGVDSKSIQDGVSPWLGITFECAGQKREINYPEDFQDPLVIELPTIKTQGKLAMDQLSIALGQVVDHWVETGACSPD